MVIPGGVGLASAESVAQNHFGSTRPSVPGRFFARNHLSKQMLNHTEVTDLTHKELATAIIRDPIAVSPEITVQAAIARMSEARSHCETDLTVQAESNHVQTEARASCVVVVQSRSIVGILTERDVVRLCAKRQSLDGLLVSQVMTASVLTLRESAFTNLLIAINFLQQNHIRHLPIVDEQNCLIGLVTHETLRQILQPSDLLRLRLVREVMTQDVLTTELTDSLLSIAQRIASHRVSSVVVVKRDRPEDLPIPIGIITERDLVQFQALALDFERYHAEQVMSSPVMTVPEAEPLVTVQHLMARYLVRQILVTGAVGELRGIVTQSNVLQALSPLELYKLTEVLETRVKQLETEKIDLLKTRTLELETQVISRTENLQKQLQREQAVTHLASQIRSSLSLQTILDTAVEQIHQIIGCDRVNLWKFAPDDSIMVVAESTHLPQSLMGERVWDECYQQHLTQVYREGHIRVVSDIYTTEMTDCHREFLIRLHTRAKVLLPLFCGEQLWGLLNVSESQTARNWQADEIDLLRNLATHLEIAIQQASIHEQLQSELQERQQAETLLQIKHDLLARVATQETLTDTLNHICTTLEGILEGALCSILLLDGNNQLRDGAAPSLPDHYRRQIDGIQVGEGMGSSGTAVHRREKVIVADIANDPLWRDFKDLALASDLRACWSTPIVAADQSILGTFAIYYREVRSPRPDEMALVDSVVHIIMLAIQRHQNEIALKQTNQRLQEAQRLAHLGNWELDLQHNTLYWSEEIFRIFEIDPQQFSPSCAAFLNLIHPEDRDAANAAYSQHLRDRQPYSLVHRLQMAEGRIKYMREHCQTSFSADGIPLISRGTAQDITQQQEAEIRRDRAEAALRQVIEGTAPVTGEAFFPALVRHIGEVLGVRCVSAGKATSEGFQVLAFCVDSELYLPQFLPYDLVPCCYQALQTGNCYHPNGLQALYPGNTLFADLHAESYLGVSLRNTAGKPTGSLCIFHDAPLADPDWAQTLLSTFAGRAGAELERLLTAQALEQLNDELEERVTQRTAELAEREARYRGLLEGAADAILLADLQGNILEANQKAEALLGYPLAELTTLHFTQLHHAEELNRVSLSFAEMLQRQRTQILDVTCYRRDGSTVPVDITATVIHISGESLVQGIFRDISDRKQEQAALQQKTTELDRFFSLALDLLCIATLDGNFVRLNHQWEKALGYPLSVLEGSQFMSFVHPEDVEATLQAMGTLNQGGEILGFTNRYRCCDGSYRWIEWRSAPSGDLIYAAARDITDRKTAEVALRESETRFRRVFASNVVGMMFTDFSGQVTDANDRFLDIIGYSRADLEASRINWAQITPPEHIEADQRAIAQLQLHGEIVPWEKEYLRPDGSRVAVLIGVALLSEIDERCVCVVLDISDRKTAEAELRRTNAELERATRLKDEFLANMSHELRTPLNAILGMTEGLQDEVFGIVNERQLKALHTVEGSANHLLSLINDILDVAKIESGQVKLDYSHVSTEQLCSSSLAFIKQQALKKRIQLQTQIPPHLPVLFVDEIRMKQVLLNLLTNAMKFTLEGGTVTLTASLLPSEQNTSQPSYLHIAVTDTGIGIAPENISRLFKPFVQIDGALNRQQTGTGLGLALVKQIVELHGGKVGLTSELGVGSCFTIDLPYEVNVPPANIPASLPAATGRDLSSTHADNPPTQSPLILLAEDNPDNVATISGYLAAKGYRLLCANNGQEAIDLAVSHHPDVILMDVQMPGMDGLEAMQHIRQQESLREIPIIALTALAMEGDRDRCLAAGADSYLSKPVKLKHLDLSIRELLHGNGVQFNLANA